MTATVEHITQEIRHLAPDEAKELWRELQCDFPQILSTSDETEAGTEEAWAAEITQREKDVGTSRVELVSADASDQRITALFARYGVQRRPA